MVGCDSLAKLYLGECYMLSLYDPNTNLDAGCDCLAFSNKCGCESESFTSSFFSANDQEYCRTGTTEESNSDICGAN